jgi:hypothetical protein
MLKRIKTLPNSDCRHDFARPGPRDCSRRRIPAGRAPGLRTLALVAALLTAGGLAPIGNAAVEESLGEPLFVSGQDSHHPYHIPALAVTTQGTLLAFCETQPAPPGDSISPQPAGAAPIPTAHTTRPIEGWTVQVDDRLLSGPDAELGGRALRLLGDRLAEIKTVMAADRVERLQRVCIWMDLTHGSLTSMQYHPSAGWLHGHGFTTNLARCVHIPDAARFLDPHHRQQQPWAVLHELAHAYHDQVLGFENAEGKALWQKVSAGGAFDSVLHIDGRMQKHYALTDQKEFFAEMSEAYFGLNDFYPFHRAELRRDFPEIFAMLETIWGPLP